MTRSILGRAALAVGIAWLAAALPVDGPRPLAAAEGAECTRPTPPTLRQVDRGRIDFKRYKAAVAAYHACAGDAADPVVREEYRQVAAQWTRLLDRWTKTLSR